MRRVWVLNKDGPTRLPLIIINGTLFAGVHQRQWSSRVGETRSALYSNNPIVARDNGLPILRNIKKHFTITILVAQHVGVIVVNRSHLPGNMLSTKEAAKRMGITSTTLIRYTEIGLIHCDSVGGTRFYSPKKIDTLKIALELSTAEVCQILKATSPTITRYVRNGLLNATRIGRTWRFSRAEVEAFEQRLPKS